MYLESSNGCGMLSTQLMNTLILTLSHALIAKAFHPEITFCSYAKLSLMTLMLSLMRRLLLLNGQLLRTNVLLMVLTKRCSCWMLCFLQTEPSARWCVPLTRNASLSCRRMTRTTCCEAMAIAGRSHATAGRKPAVILLSPGGIDSACEAD